MSDQDQTARSERARRRAAATTPDRPTGVNLVLQSPAGRTIIRTPPRPPSAAASTASPSSQQQQQQQPANSGVATTGTTYKTPDQTPESLDHLLFVVFNLEERSPLDVALQQLGIATFEDFLAVPDSDFASLQYHIPQYTDSDGTVHQAEDRLVPLPMRSLCRGFAGFNAYRNTALHRPITPDNCMEITREEWGIYRCSPHFSAYINGAGTATPATLTTVQSTRTKAEDFNRSLKIDPTYYPFLKDDKGFNSFEIKLVAQARIHGMSNVLDPNYIPSTIQDIELFDRHQSFMFSMFATHVSTSKGKELIRKCKDKYDAQKLWSDLRTYHRESAKSEGRKSTLMTWITSTKLDRDSWQGSHEDFITHWTEQVRLY